MAFARVLAALGIAVFPGIAGIRGWNVQRIAGMSMRVLLTCYARRGGFECPDLLPRFETSSVLKSTKLAMRRRPPKYSFPLWLDIARGTKAGRDKQCSTRSTDPKTRRNGKTNKQSRTACSICSTRKSTSHCPRLFCLRKLGTRSRCSAGVPPRSLRNDNQLGDWYGAG